MSNDAAGDIPAWKTNVPIVDAHQHFWDRSLQQFDHSWQEEEGLHNICRSFLPRDLQPWLDSCGVDYTIFVQTQHDLEENRWALSLAESHRFLQGVVGWVDISSPDCESQLLEFIDHPLFVGVRHVTQDEADPDFIVRADVSRGLAVLQRHEIPFDLLFYAKHLKHAATVARRFPNLPLVIDHLAKPEIHAGRIDRWRAEMADAAACANVYCKLSGLVTEANWEDWSAADLQPYIDVALEQFGPKRLMFGSDWPVCHLAATYRQVWEAALGCLSQLSDDEKAQIFGQTAINFYRLKI